MIQFLIIESTPQYTAKERAEGINRELWRLSIPESEEMPNQVTQKVFSEVTHPTTGQVALMGDFDYEIVRYHDGSMVDISKLISYISENTSQVEIDLLSQYVMNTPKFPFRNILPSVSVVISLKQAELDGWFQEPIE